MNFDVNAARSAGYSDDEIADFLAKENNFDLAGAVSSGYSTSEVIGFLSGPPAAPAPQADAGVSSSADPARYELPRTIEPSRAGGGRGFVNPPMAGEAQPRRATVKADERILGVYDNIDAGKGASGMSAYEYRGASPEKKRQLREQSGEVFQARGEVPAVPKTKAQPQPYKNRVEALDDAINLLEEGVPKERVVEAFGQGGITWDEITRHGVANKREYFQRRPEDMGIVAPQRPMSGDATPGEIKAWEPTVGQGIVNTAVRGVEAAGRTVDIVRNRAGLMMPDDALAERIAQRQRRIGAAMPGSETQQGMQEIGDTNEKGFLEAASALARNPVAAISMLAESVIASSPAVALSIGGSALGPVGGAAGGFAGGMAMEYGSTIYDTMVDAGMNPGSAQDVARALADKDLMARAEKRGEARGITIGAFSALTSGVAAGLGRSIKTAVEAGKVGRAAGLAGAAGAVGVIGDGTGEYAAQKAVGDKTKYADILLEAGAGLPGALGDAAGAGIGAALRSERGAQEERLPTAETLNFTPPNSPTAQAGLTPVVVPVPRQGVIAGEMDAGTTGPVQPATAGRIEPRGLIGGASMEPAGLAGLDPIGDVRPGADGMAPVDGAARAVGDAGTQRPAPVKGDPLRRTADTDLLARAEAAQPAPTEQPTTIWTGRKGDGYDTRGDAELALPTRVKREPDLRWEIEQMPSGKFRLAGYEQQPAAQPAPQPQALTAQQFMQNPAQAIETAQQITFAPGQMGAVKVSDRKALNSTFSVQEMGDGTTVFTRAAAPAGAPAVAGGLGQRAAQPSAEQQSVVLSDLNKASAGRFAAVATNTPFASVAQRIAAAFGRPVMLVRDSARNAGFNALFYPRQGVIAANVDGDRPMYAVVTHEVYHGLPDDIRQRTTEAVMATVTPEQRADFLAAFSAYQKADAKAQDEELVARIIEQDAENPEFWQKLADRMGDGEFAKLAREILGMLDRLLAGFTRENSSEFTSDIKRVREVVADAYAEAQARMGQTSDAEAMASTPRKRETVGEYQAIPYKDGSTTILGDVDEIRSKLPDDVKGRVVDGGIRFTTSDSQRVRAALEGRQVAYSRAGAVLDKLPMKDGKYLGAPPDYDTPAKIPTLRKILRNLTKEGEAGRFWYENSSKAVLRMTGGNVQEARKFVALLAIYSPQAKVDTNTTFAIRAWSQYKAGQPISVKTKVMDQKAAKAMQDIDAFWSGEKTGNFFFNLLREIDPTTEGKQGATIDMWMMRAGMYPTDAPTKTQYAFMENETNRIAAEMGWEPQQVQAAIWVAMKARMENAGVKKRTEASSEKKGWIRFDRDAKGKKVRVILDAQKHRDNWLAHAMRHVPSTTDTRTAKFDFEDGLFRHIGQISFEARPGRTSGSLPGIHSAPYAQQVEFQQAVQKTFYDERGTDMLASYLGLMIDNDILAPGVWQGEVSPSTQMSTVMAPAGGKAGKTSVDPSQKKLLNVYASVLGLLTRQEGVGWHRPFYSAAKRDANGLDIDISRPVNPQEAADLERAVGEWMRNNGHPEWQDDFAFVSSPKGIRLVNFGIITNKMLQDDIVKVAESVLPDFDYRVFASDGAMPTNKWKENPNGESYVQGIRAAGRPDVLDWARANLAPRIDAVFRDFAERYNWGDPGDVRFSAQRDGAGRQGAGRAAPGPMEAPERAAQEAALMPLPGAPKVPGFHGPDPRLVAVAEKYAADNGIELRRQSEYVQVDPVRAARIAEAYEAMPHAPQDPQVREAYENLIRQTRAQYDALVDAGYQFWFMDMSQPTSQEYASTPWDAMRDIRANKQMGVFPTEDGFGTSEDFTPESNPLLADTGLEWPSGSLTGPRKRVLANDLFRAVHDAFGHGLEGSGFRAQGEENAWQAHVRLFTGSAVGAITSETRGQNSWLNYGPYGETNRTAQVEDTVFADQKTGLMPEWTWTEGRAGDMPMASVRRAVSGELAAAGITQDAVDAFLKYRTADRAVGGDPYTAGRGAKAAKTRAYRAVVDMLGGDDAARVPMYRMNMAYDMGGEEALYEPEARASAKRYTSDQIDEAVANGFNPVSARELRKQQDLLESLPGEAMVAINAYWKADKALEDAIREGSDNRTLGSLKSASTRTFKRARDAIVDAVPALGTDPTKLNPYLTDYGRDLGDYLEPEVRASAQRQTDTPEFKRWFGDSKVVDAEGEPLVVYHGTRGDFNKFDISRLGSAMGNTGFLGAGFYFTNNDFMASGYSGGRTRVGDGSNVMPVYLSLQNPLNISGERARIGGREGAIPNEVVDAINAALPSKVDGKVQYGDEPMAVQDLLAVAVESYPEVARQFTENLKAAGYDGVIFSNGYEIVAFRPEQIKSAIGNNGRFDPENPDIRMSARRNAPIQGSRFTLPGMDGNRIRWDKIRRALQDDALRMKRVQDAVLAGGGVVNEEQNFYDANTLMPGRVQTMMDDFRNDVIKPMIEKAAKAKIDLEELSLYAYAKHAQERNEYIASINPKMQDGGSGMLTADANKILADIAASGKQAQYDDLHQDLMSITETTRRVLLDEGLITQEQFDAMEQQYGNYIPLRGFENVDEETGAIRPGIGRGINVRGKETIKALGRASRAGDLIENVIRDYQRAVVRSEKNNVAKVLLDFVLSNPDPDLWGVDVDKTTTSFDKKRGIVQYTTTIDKGEDTIGVKVGGQQVYIKLADKDLTRALKQSFKDEVSGLERATVAMSGWYNNLMRNVLTRYNPPFAMVNAIRDAQSGLVAALDELGAAGAARFSAHLPKAIAATTADETKKMWLSNPLTQQYLREFKAAGAVTGGFFMRNLDDIAQDLRDDLLMAGAAPRTLGEKAKYNPATKLAYKGSVKFLRALELMGAASENATRFALYMAARDMGRTPAQAALLAKNGTTNFNRKGEWGGALNNLYLFFNAAVQGNAQLFKTLKNPKVVAALTGVAGLSVTLAFLNAGMGGEDDDGEKYWDKVPNYEKERNLIIMLRPGDTIGEGINRVGKRGRYIKIPVQYGLNFFPNLGYSISDVIRNAQDPRQGKTATKAGMHMASTFFGSINPFGGSLDLTDAVSVGMAVAPTIADLPIQLASERNAFGTPTASERMGKNDTRPDSERMFVSQMDSFAADLAKVMNEMGGGNQSKPGKILGIETSVTPGTIRTIIAGTTGGLGAFFEQIYDTTTGAISDDRNVKTNRIPLLNKVYGEAGEDINVRLAGDRMREVEATVKVIKDQIGDGIKPDVTDEDKRLWSIANAQETYNKQSAKLRKDEIDVIRSTTMTPEQKRIARDNIMAARDRLATGANRVYLNSFGINEKGAGK